MKTIITEVIRAVTILGIVFILSGCNTIEGFGKDTQELAKSSRVALQDYAERR